MASEDAEKTLDPTPKKLADARAQGDIAMSREGSVAGGYFAALLGMALLGGPTARHLGDMLVPFIDQPDAFGDMTPGSFATAGLACLGAVAIAIAPLFAMMVAGAIVPHVLQNSIVFSSARMQPKLSNLSPAKAWKRLFGARALFEFGKSLAKMGVVGTSCYVIAHPLYASSPNLIGLDIRALLPLLSHGLVSLLGVITALSVVIAGIDVPYQHWAYRRRHRMSLEEVKDELKNTDGNPQIKQRLRRIRRERSRKRMMHDVKRASVVITNPTHYAVALRYERNVDAAPVVLAKGLDLIAQNIKQIARDNNVPVMEDRPLARALHASAEIGDTIPREHFEAVAKIIGLIWAQNGQLDAKPKPQGASVPPP